VNPLFDQASELLAAARRDQKTLEILLRDADSPLEAMLFHAQQAVEKSLKAALVSRNILFRRTHDLLALADMLEAGTAGLPIDRDLLLRLGPYAVEFRYQGVRAPEVGTEEARFAVETCLRWALNELQACSRQAD
jgi:HEPN domain-containing protein